MQTFFVAAFYIGLLWGSAFVPAAASSCPDSLEQHLQSDLKLPFREFDQSETSGWRPLAKAECNAEAAILIERYIGANEKVQPVLSWHLAQTLAFAGDYKRAIPAAKQTLWAEPRPEMADFMWNDYVLATIAFLEADSGKFATHRDNLADAANRGAEGPTRQINRMNLAVVDRLRACFGKPYKVALECSGQ